MTHLGTQVMRHHITPFVRHGLRRMSLLQCAFRHPDRVAVVDGAGAHVAHTYASLDAKAETIKAALRKEIKVCVQ